MEDRLDEVREQVLKFREHCYPILDENEKVVGVLTRYHLLRPRRKRVVLVDHNEASQSVPGLEAAEILGTDRYKKQIERISLATMERGWDAEYGGFYHFVPSGGFDRQYTVGDTEENPQLRLVLDDYGSKLWWVHSEAVYTALLMLLKTGNEAFAPWFERIVEYTFTTFPNPDRSVGEWIQIRTREGKPQDKVVALPVKDPYHIIRNLLLAIELLEKERSAQ